jgi:hypothetical protein
LFSIVDVLAYIPSNVRGFLFPCILANNLLFLVFHNGKQSSFFSMSSSTFVVLVVAILTGMMSNHYLVFIFISFMARGGEHFFLCFLAIYISLRKFCWFFFYFFTGSLNFGEFKFFEFPVYSVYQSLVRCKAGKDFLPLYW